MFITMLHPREQWAEVLKNRYFQIDFVAMMGWQQITVADVQTGEDVWYSPKEYLSRTAPYADECARADEVTYGALREFFALIGAVHLPRNQHGDPETAERRQERGLYPIQKWDWWTTKPITASVVETLNTEEGGG